MSQTPEKPIEIIGTVCSGRGYSKSIVLRCSDELSKINERFYPGSLNILLDRPVRLVESLGFKFDDAKRRIWPGLLNDNDIFIFRWNTAPLHVIEIFSDKKLRDYLHLKDGDTVRIQIHEKYIEKISAIEHMFWYIFWKGRLDWVYSNDRYNSFARSSVGLGTTQQPITSKGAFWSLYIMLKKIIKHTPIVGPAAKFLISKIKVCSLKKTSGSSFN